MDGWAINSRFSWSKAATWLLGLTLVLFAWQRPPGNPLAWDVFGYYYYLPATFIQGELSPDNIGWVEEINKKYQSSSTLYQFYKWNDGKWIDKYSMGWAMLYSPFFAGGHLAAKMGMGEADGYSEPYQTAAILGGLFYALLGVVMLRKVLLKFFSEAETAVLLLLIVAGTNYYHQAAFQSTMPHNVLFAMWTLILWFTIRWHENQQWKHAIGLAVVCALAILTRPTELLALMIPVLWSVTDLKTLKAKVALMWKHKLQIAAMGVIGLMLAFPQMWYWKKNTGEWLFFSYNNNAGEGFEFTSPYLLETLFSYRKGWFIYTPLMLFAVVGMASLWRNRRELFLPVFLFFALNTWVVSSWSCWWYADSFGQRPFVQSYPLMAIPLGFLLTEFVRNKAWMRTAALSLFGLLMLLNIFQTWQMEAGIIHSSRMTKAYYWHIFGKTSVEPGTDSLLMVNRSFAGPEIFTPNAKYASKLIYQNGFESFEDEKMNEIRIDSLAAEGKYCVPLTKDWVFTPAFKQHFRGLTSKDHAWVIVKFKVYPLQDPPANDISAVLHFVHKGQAYKYTTIRPEKDWLRPYQWNSVSVAYLTPEVRNLNDSLVTYLWLQGENAVLVDDFQVEVHEPK